VVVGTQSTRNGSGAPTRIRHACAGVLACIASFAACSASQRQAGPIPADSVAFAVAGCQQLEFEWTDSAAAEPWTSRVENWGGRQPLLAVGLWDSPEGVRGLIWRLDRADDPAISMNGLSLPTGELLQAGPDSVDLMIVPYGFVKVRVRLGSAGDGVSGRLTFIYPEFGDEEKTFPGTVRALPAPCGDEVDTLIDSTGYGILIGASPIDLGRDDFLPMRPETPAEAAAFRARRDSLVASARSR